MRYSLRTLLIVMMLGGPALAGAWWWLLWVWQNVSLSNRWGALFGLPIYAVCVGVTLYNLYLAYARRRKDQD